MEVELVVLLILAHATGLEDHDELVAQCQPVLQLLDLSKNTVLASQCVEANLFSTGARRANWLVLLDAMMDVAGPLGMNINPAQDPESSMASIGSQDATQGEEEFSTMLSAARALVLASGRRLKRLKELFEAWDAKGQGVVGLGDMTAFMRVYHKEDASSEEEAEEQAQMMLSYIDIDGDGVTSTLSHFHLSLTF